MQTGDVKSEVEITAKKCKIKSVGDVCHTVSQVDISVVVGYIDLPSSFVGHQH